MKNKLVKYFIIGIFTSLYFLVATISMINSIDFFNMAHNESLSWALAIGFELGAAASLAAIIILDKTNKWIVWSLFILLTSFQMMANSYHAYANLENYDQWIELFGLVEEEEIFQKRILSIVSGAILPVVALGFIKSLTDYLKPEEEVKESEEETEYEDLDFSDEEPNEKLKEAAKRYFEQQEPVKGADSDSTETKQEDVDGSNNSGAEQPKPNRGGAPKYKP